MLGPLEAGGDQRRYFHATYQRTTIAVADEIKRGGFEDPEWVERWDVAFAGLYLDALQTALAGRMTVTPDGGAPQEVGTGDCAVVPRGWTGTWQIHETIRKLYVIY